jgi:intracellular sulfur oxidation DsrE/DsrF family protein
VFACLHADQNRIFPIGQSDLGLHVLEVHQLRSDNDFKPVWKCKYYHKVYNEQQEVVHADTLDERGFFSENIYIQVAQLFFLRAHKIALTFNSLRLMNPDSIYFCDYSRVNPEAKVEFDTTKNTVYVRLISGKKYPITVLNKEHSISRNMLLATNDESENSLEELVSKLAPMICANSVRKFKIGNRQLTIVHLGIGQILRNGNGDYPEPHGYFLKKQLSHVFDAIFFEEVMHHGSGFDFMIWE